MVSLSGVKSIPWPTTAELMSKEGDKAMTTYKAGNVKSGALRGGDLSGYAASAYRVEKSSAPEAYQHAPERIVPNGAATELTTVLHQRLLVPGWERRIARCAQDVADAWHG
jgi:hypothetical protein